MRWSWSVAAALGWVLAFAYSFAPFDVSLHRITSSASTETGNSDYVALVLHLVAFAALGFIDRRGRRAGNGVDTLDARFLAKATLLCVLIETGQLFLVSRHAEFADLAVNVAGLVLGNIAAGAIGRLAPDWLSSTARVLRTGNGRLVYVTAWGLLWSAAILAPARLVALESWDPTFALVVGDEKSGERGWHGNLAYLAFYDRALTPDEVSARLRTPPNTLEGKRTRIQVGLVAGYDFTKHHPSVLEAEGPLNDPALRIELPQHSRQIEEQSSSVMLGDGPLVRSAGTAESLSTRLASRNAFSIEAWLRPATLEQTGPARIASISETPFRRNVMLGQEGSAYHFRVRNQLNGENGTRHELVCRAAAALAAHQLVATYDRGVSTLFRDGRAMCAVDLREPSVMLRLGGGRISGMVTALIAALSLMLAMAVAGAATSLGWLLAIGYAWLLSAFGAGLLLSFVPAPSLYIWFGPALVLSWMCLPRPIDGGRKPRARR